MEAQWFECWSQGESFLVILSPRFLGQSLNSNELNPKEIAEVFVIFHPNIYREWICPRAYTQSSPRRYLLLSFIRVKPWHLHSSGPACFSSLHSHQTLQMRSWAQLITAQSCFTAPPLINLTTSTHANSPFTEPGSAVSQHQHTNIYTSSNAHSPCLSPLDLAYSISL